MKAKKSKPIKLGNKTVLRLRKRKLWRMRTLDSALRFATWPTGSPRAEIEKQLANDLARLKEWFGERRSAFVIGVIQRRAVNEFRKR